MLVVRLPADIEQRLNALAKATGRTKTFYAREAILRYLDELEDASLAENAYRHFRESGEKSIPLQEVMKEYDLGD